MVEEESPVYALGEVNINKSSHYSATEVSQCFSFLMRVLAFAQLLEHGSPPAASHRTIHIGRSLVDERRQRRVAHAETGRQ